MQSSNHQHLNPLKRSFSSLQEDQNYGKPTKRLIKTLQKEVPKKTFDAENRHFLMLSALKHSGPNAISLYDIKAHKEPVRGTYIFEILDQNARELLKEKQRKIQQELELYKEQMAYYSQEDCCNPGNPAECIDDLKYFDKTFH